eukprot:633618-Prymnesium_polylepis.1
MKSGDQEVAARRIGNLVRAISRGRGVEVSAFGSIGGGHAHWSRASARTLCVDLCAAFMIKHAPVHFPERQHDPPVCIRREAR